MPAKTPEDIVAFNEYVRSVGRPDFEVRVLVTTKNNITSIWLVSPGGALRNQRDATMQSYYSASVADFQKYTDNPAGVGRWHEPQSDKPLFPWGQINIGKVTGVSGNCRGAYTVLSSDAAKGYGPMLYDMALVVAGKDGLMPDRHLVSQYAARVWYHYFGNRSDVKTLPLDPDGKLTPDDPSDDCKPKYHIDPDWNAELKGPNKDKFMSAMNTVYYDNGIKTLDRVRELGLLHPASDAAVGKTLSEGSMCDVVNEEDLQKLYESMLIEAGYNRELLKRMGYKFIGRNKRLGSDTFIHARDDNSPSYHKGLQKAVNNNINKAGWFAGSGSSLKDPAATGISLPKRMKG